MRDAGSEQVITTVGNTVSPVRTEVHDIDKLRAAEYDLLSLLLGKAPDSDTLLRVAALKGDASDLGMTHVESPWLLTRRIIQRSPGSSSISSSDSAAATCFPMLPIT